MERDRGASSPAQVRLPRIAALISLGVVAGAVWAATDFWDTKDWTGWDQMQCLRITGARMPGPDTWVRPPFASPWANSVRTVTVPMGAFVGVHEVDELSGQFRSALPIRLALARQKQLEHNGKLSPEQRQAAENQIQSDLAQWAEKSAAQVIFHVTFSHYQTGNNGQARIAQQMPRPATLIFSDGTHFTSSAPLGIQQDDVSVSYNVTFPREVDGKPLIRPEDKKFKVAFDGYYKELEFDASKMIFRGKLEY